MVPSFSYQYSFQPISSIGVSHRYWRVHATPSQSRSEKYVLDSCICNARKYRYPIGKSWLLVAWNLWLESLIGNNSAQKQVAWSQPREVDRRENNSKHRKCIWWKMKVFPWIHGDIQASISETLKQCYPLPGSQSFVQLGQTDSSSVRLKKGSQTLLLLRLTQGKAGQEWQGQVHDSWTIKDP